MMFVVSIVPDKHDWINYKVSVEQHMEAEIKSVGGFVKEMVDGMRKAKYQVIDKHCQQGPCCLIQKGATARLELTNGNAKPVLSHLEYRNNTNQLCWLYKGTKV